MRRRLRVVEFQKGDLVQAVLSDDQGNAVRRAEFVEICEPSEAVTFRGQRVDAAWVRWLDGDDEGLLGRVPRPLEPVKP